MKKTAAIILIALVTNLAQAFDPSQYNVVWRSQSQNSSQSMPCGGGDVGLNVWVENGDLLFYISRSGAFDENSVFPKLGRIRLELSPNPFVSADFKQELKLREGFVEIQTIRNGKKTTIEIWVDVFRAVVRANIQSPEPTQLTATYETWRFEDLVWNDPGRVKASIAYRDAPFKATVYADSVNFKDQRVVWYHQNRKKTIFDATVTQQHLDPVKDSLWNPLSGLTFGGYMQGQAMKPSGVIEGKYASTPFRGWQITSDRATKKHQIEVGLFTQQVQDISQWHAGLELLRKDAASDKMARKKTEDWWAQFWDRSHIVINADTTTAEWKIGRNYQLFRYQLACNAYGAYPTKFNGGLFTFDPEYVKKDSPYTPDHRDWGGGTHTAQNQRLVYFPMFRSGDFDMIPPQIDFYSRSLKNAEIRTQQYWGHKGASFTEHPEPFGLTMAGAYGWKRPAVLDPGVEHNAWIEHQWDTQLEFCLMALELYKYQKTDISRYLPLIESCLTFFDEHYQYEARSRGVMPLDSDGNLIIYPGSACETYKVTYNASSTIAGLIRLTTQLLTLPNNYLSPQRRAHWQGFLERIPPIPFRYIGDKKSISPAIVWSRITNIEIPQLYPVYPWGLYGVGLKDLDVAINTWRYGLDNKNQRGYVSWHQDAIFCARMGLTQEAKEVTLKKFADAPRRFPTFWGPGHDWVPDHNWGGSAMIGLQEMIMQTPDDKIHILPAFPKEWNVEFKLHGPNNTIVSGRWQDGKMVDMKVLPQERAKDVVVHDKQPL